MPRKSAGARLYCRPDNGLFVIRDGSRAQSTGTRDRRDAEAALARYIAERDRPVGPRDTAQVTVAEVLDLYGHEHAPNTKDPSRIGYAIAALLPVLGALPISKITGETCRRYGKARSKADGTVRKELGVLQAALNYCHAEGYVTTAVKVRLPAKPAPRDRWLTRDEAAKLLRAAYRTTKCRHVARFILVALYTGSRSDAILGLRFMPHAQGGYVDCETGMLYRRPPGQAETKKRQPPIPIPRPLLAQLRRWQREGGHFVVEARGGRCGHIRRAWQTALEVSGIEHCTRHDLRRTAVTWAMQASADKWAAAGYFGLSLDILESTYGHHHPDYLRSAVEAMERKPGSVPCLPRAAAG